MAQKNPSRAVQPAYPPPEGLESNFVDPEDHSGMVYRVGYGITIAAFVASMIRLYTRIFVLKRGLLADDYLVIIAMILSLGFIVTTFKAAEYGMGRHLYDVPFDEYSPYFLMYMTASTVIWALLVSYSLISTFTTLFGYSPVHATWDYRLAVQASAVCLDRKNAIYATRSRNVITDFTIVLLLMPKLRGSFDYTWMVVDQIHVIQE
ncbi:hypothetical protein PG993_010668 [Apiospora rasikravindrae]|uniref:Rhodopsin domain-containing protein n=1 Tax=Apiospora rasikravindrae TaxID=990691 RepID=A0ABR1SQA5_9PEZI